MSDTRLQVGFRDMFRFGVGAAVPAEMLITGLIIAVYGLIGGDMNQSVTVGFTAGIVAALALELFRRVVLLRGPSSSLVRLFRLTIWGIVGSAVPVTVLLGIGVLDPCYGHACTDTGKIMVDFMFAVCLCMVPMVRLAYLLLRDAVWLQGSGGR